MYITGSVTGYVIMPTQGVFAPGSDVLEICVFEEMYHNINFNS